MSNIVFLLPLLLAIQGGLAQEFVNVPLPGTTEFELKYFIVEDKITFEYTAKTLGWVGLGLSNSTGMAPADMAIGGKYSDGDNYFNDYHTVVGHAAPETDAQPDWAWLEVQESATETTIRISRLLVTGDAQDVAVEDKVQTIIWAFGENDQLAYHGTKKGVVLFNLIENYHPSTTPPSDSNTTTTTPVITTTTTAVTTIQTPSTDDPTTTPSSQPFINIPLPGTTEYQLRYFISGESITFECKANTYGWVGLGLSNSTGMADADMAIGGKFGNETNYFGDYHTVESSPPILDGQQDWRLLGVQDGTNERTMTITRALVTGDTQDVAVEDKTHVIIWAFGLTDDLGYHDGRKGTVSFNLIQNSIPTTTPASGAALVKGYAGFLVFMFGSLIFM